MIDSIPLWFALVVGVASLVVYIRLEYRASLKYWAARDASGPVVVTGSGHRSNRHPRACGGAR